MHVLSFVGGRILCVFVLCSESSNFEFDFHYPCRFSEGVDREFKSFFVFGLFFRQIKTKRHFQWRKKEKISWIFHVLRAVEAAGRLRSFERRFDLKCVFFYHFWNWNSNFMRIWLHGLKVLAIWSRQLLLDIGKRWRISVLFSDMMWATGLGIGFWLRGVQPRTTVR